MAQQALILSDKGLATCSGEKLAKGLWEAIPELHRMVAMGPEHGQPFLPKYLRGHIGSGKWRRFFDENVVEYAPGVYGVRYLDPDYCAKLVEEFQRVPFVPNDEEPLDAQIPELVLESANNALYECLRGLHNGYIRPLAALLTAQNVTQCQSIQAARYTPENTPHGCWHTDQDSESTLVVALSDEHEGGGTEVYMGPFRPTITVPQLPVGWAMLFNGRHNMHQGLPVTKGTRNLLVHWYNFED